MSNLPAVGSSNRAVASAAPIVVTRPNNAVPYVAGSVWGDAADARIAFVVPALPADAMAGVLGFAIMSTGAVLTRNRTDATPIFNLILFSAQPATVLGDNAAFDLSDADRALAYPSQAGARLSAQFPAVTLSSDPGQLNNGAGLAGRKVMSAATTLAPGQYFAGGATVYGYLWVAAAYNPLALETITFFPAWTYVANPAL